MNSTSIVFDILTFLTVAFEVILQEILNICIATMAMPLATKKFNLTGNSFGLKFFLFFNNPSLIYIRHQKACIPTLAAPLTAKKSNPTSAKFELQFVLYFRFFIYYYVNVNEINNILLWNNKSVTTVNEIFKKINRRGGPLCLINIHLLACSILHGYSLLLRPVDQQQKQLAVRVCSRCYAVRPGVEALAKG